MATLIQRNSQDLLVIDAPMHGDSVKEAALEATKKTTQERSQQNDEGCSLVMRRLDELMQAWGQGRFNMPETFHEACQSFFTKDIVIDAGSANEHAGVPELKSYTLSTMKEWFDYLATFEITNMVVTAVQSSKDASQVWQQCVWTATHKATGKSLRSENINIIDFDGAMIKRLTILYADSAHHAYLNGKQESPTEVKLPAFEPHPDPMPVYEAVFAMWASGEFAKPETKQASFDKTCDPQVVVDVSNAALPTDIFKAYHGHAGVDAWANGVFGKWEFTRMDITAVVGLKPGCVTQRLDCDVKHEGKEAKGIVIYIELAYDADGKMVYNKHFWANPQVVASLYASGC